MRSGIVVWPALIPWGSAGLERQVKTPAFQKAEDWGTRNFKTI